MNNLNSSAPKINYKLLTIILGILVLVIAIILILTLPEKTTQVDTGLKVIDQGGEITVVTSTPDVVPADAHIEVKGASPVSNDNKVLAKNGEVATNNAVSGSAAAPKLSEPLTKEEIPDTALSMTISDDKGFSPKVIEVKRGVPLTISLTNNGSLMHIFKFDDGRLDAVAIRTFAGETRAMTFNVPETPGEYTFRCAISSHVGETGKLIVK